MEHIELHYVNLISNGFKVIIIINPLRLTSFPKGGERKGGEERTDNNVKDNFTCYLR